MPAPTFPEIDTACDIGAMTISDIVYEILDDNKSKKKKRIRKAIDKYYDTGRGSPQFENVRRRLKAIKDEMAKRFKFKGA